MGIADGRVPVEGVVTPAPAAGLQGRDRSARCRLFGRDLRQPRTGVSPAGSSSRLRVDRSGWGLAVRSVRSQRGPRRRAGWIVALWTTQDS